MEKPGGGGVVKTSQCCPALMMAGSRAVQSQAAEINQEIGLLITVASLVGKLVVFPPTNYEVVSSPVQLRTGKNISEIIIIIILFLKKKKMKF